MEQRDRRPSWWETGRNGCYEEGRYRNKKAVRKENSLEVDLEMQRWTWEVKIRMEVVKGG